MSAMITLVREAADRVGGLNKLAKGLGIRHTSFYSWKKIPAERVLKFEELTGIPRHEQRPDIYPGPSE